MFIFFLAVVIIIKLVSLKLIDSLFAPQSASKSNHLKGLVLLFLRYLLGELLVGYLVEVLAKFLGKGACVKFTLKHLFHSVSSCLSRASRVLSIAVVLSLLALPKESSFCLETEK